MTESSHDVARLQSTNPTKEQSGWVVVVQHEKEIGDWDYKWGVARYHRAYMDAPNQSPVLVIARKVHSVSDAAVQVPLAKFYVDPLRSSVIFSGVRIYDPRPPEDDAEHCKILQAIGWI